MKTKLYSIIALGLIGMSQLALADSPKPSEPTTFVYCTDTNKAPGTSQYSVSITGGGISGVMLAAVIETKGKKSKTAATFPVALNDMGMEQIYTSKGFKLDIALESWAPTAKHQSSLKFSNMGKIYKANLKCELMNQSSR